MFTGRMAYTHMKPKIINLLYPIEIIKKVNLNNKIIGIGETGLDFFYDHSDRSIQKKLFIEHIKAAQDLNLPLIVHTRSAEERNL